MSIQSLIPQATIHAYRGTHYDVFADPAFTLRIGTKSDALALLYSTYNVASAAFVTAANPFGELTEATINVRNQERLKREIERTKLTCFNGAGRDPLGEWPIEPSVLILGIERDQATELGTRYRQNAIVWCSTEATPELVLLR